MFFRPLEFKELVSKNAQNIDWNSIVGKDASFDQNDDEDDISTNIKKESDNAEDSNLVKSQKNTTQKIAKIEPVAGPWATVAKNIQ